MGEVVQDQRPRTARQIAREEMTRRIVELARAQLREVGPGQLSLRAIARKLDISSSAIYRYFVSRDDLLTALLVEVYDEVGDVLEKADQQVTPRSAYAQRFLAVAHALRDWARAHPYDWALLYGSPVPGYAAPEDTVLPAGRATGAFTAIVEDADAAGHRPRGSGAPLSAEARASVAGLEAMLPRPIDEDLLLAGMAAWSGVMGAISLELFGHLHLAVVDYDAYFRAIVGILVESTGLQDGEPEAGA